MRTRTWQGVLIVGSMTLVAFTSVLARPTPVNVTITPDNQSSGEKYVNTSGHSASFTITYGADELDPEEGFSLWCDGTQGIQCSVQSSIVLYPNSPQNVDVTFSTGSSSGTGYVNLYAFGWTTEFQDQGSHYYSIEQSATVDPLSVPSSVIQHSQDQTATFTVTNNSGSAKTYTMTCNWGAAACAPSPASPYLTPSQDTVVTVTFDAGGLPAAYNLKLTATSGADTGYEQQSVTVSEFLSVNAVAQNAQIYAVPNTQRADSFVVRFPGQAQSLFAMSVSCPGISCSVPAASDTMNVGDTAVKVPVNYTPGNNGTTSTVTLTASKVGTAWISNGGSLTVTATSSVLVSVDDANHGMEINRGDCVTISAGAGAISCDDFQYVYPFTPISRMSRSRQLALLYNTGTWAGDGIVGANFVLPPGVAEPDSIKATLVMNGATVRTQSYDASLYAPGVKTRIAFDWASPSVLKYSTLPTFSVTIEPWVGGSAQTSVAASGKQLSLSLDDWYGRGWWLAGLEKLDVHGDTLLWTGPDAGGAAYLKSGDVWIRQTRSVPDTIIQIDSTYVRRALGGGAVHYAWSGEHTKTVDRNGNETRFNQALVESDTTVADRVRLLSVELPTPTGSDTVYKFTYDSFTAGLMRVLVRRTSTAWDTFRIHTSFDGDWSTEVDSIVAPDGTKTRFKDVGSHSLIDTIIGPRGDKTGITYAYWKVTQLKVKAVDIPDLVMNYTAASTIGRETSGGRAPRPVEDVRSTFDGPLAGFADLTHFYTTGWGAVRGIRNALGDSTWIDRQDAAFPALPTRVRYPNGWQVTAAYTAGGLPDTIIDRSTGAVTTYTWNTTWRAPTSVKSPEGVITAYTYDGNGNRLTQSVGQDTVKFGYQADFLVDSIIDPIGRVTSLSYDNSSGNLAWEFTPDSIRTNYWRDYRGFPTKVARPSGEPNDSVFVETTRDVMGRDSVVLTRNTQDNLRTLVRTTYEFGQVKKVEPLGVDYIDGQWDTVRTGASEWIYDGLGRAVVAKTPVSADTIQYDLAGQVTRTISNGDTVTMTYDVLGLLRSRRTSQRTFGVDTVAWGWVFPAFEPSGFTVAAATDTFTYDVLGNLRTAHNPYSRITRGYGLNGALTSEIDSLKNYGSGSFSTHVYARSYIYDRDGRRLHVVHPTWINSGTDRTDYAYNGTTGRLSSVTDPLGNLYSFTYFADGQQKTKTFPSGVDSMTYDFGGRVATWKIRINGGSPLVSQTLAYDRIGRVQLPGQMYYNGLGHVSEHHAEVEEYFTRDAFGNATYHRRYGDFQSVSDPGTEYLNIFPTQLGGRLSTSTEQWKVTGGGNPLPQAQDWAPMWTAHAYDSRGNLDASISESYGWSFSGGQYGYDVATVELWDRSFSKSYYAADGKLRLHQVDRDSVDFYYNGQVIDTTFTDPWGAYDEFWYDALGRRILKRTREEAPTCTFSSRCYSAIERFVWDGDQILWELRQANAGDTQDPAGGAQTGHVGYVHAGGIDAPLGMIRNDTALVLHRDLRGRYLGATTTSGALFGNDVPWPSYGVPRFLSGALFDPHATFTWVGSLPMSQEDATGLSYRRNRYYNTETGQFTQVDPIGIAGGLNLYGYANGDPINFSDPFGLKSYVACRPVGGRNRRAADTFGNAGDEVGDEGKEAMAHCAVRVLDEEAGMDQLMELAPDGVASRVFAAGAGSARIAAYGNEWVELAVPGGMTSAQFDRAVLRGAAQAAREFDGATYFFTGERNSNRFVHRAITLAGGVVPASVTGNFLLAPGICGGGAFLRGQRCR